MRVFAYGYIRVEYDSDVPPAERRERHLAVIQLLAAQLHQPIPLGIPGLDSVEFVLTEADDETWELPTGDETNE